MGLIRKSVTPRLLAANRANSQRSTGPRTELGKRRASRNAGKHLIYATVSPDTMKELGEDPAEFEKLRESLRQAFEPRDGFEESLVEDMAEIRWRQKRLVRAEAGILAARKRQFDIQRELNCVDRRTNPELRDNASAFVFAGLGLVSLPDSHHNSARILGALAGLMHSIADRGFSKDDRAFLDLVYEKQGYLLAAFDRCCDHPQEARSEEQEAERRDFLNELNSEITAYEKIVELCRARDVETTRPMQDAQLLLSQKNLDKILRYETGLERHFLLKLQELMAWRQAKGEPLRS